MASPAPCRRVQSCVPLGLFLALALGVARADAEPAVPAATASGTARREQNVTASAQRRRELEDLRREDIAAQLALLGVPLKWQDHSLAELVDWRDRIEAAVTLRVQYRVDVDWRVISLRELIDMRLRAAKASELSSRFGIRVDWRRYSWVALESLRRQMSRSDRRDAVDPVAGDALAVPGSVGRARRPGARPRDPDAIIEPTFTFDTTLAWSRPFGRSGKADPDAILIPTFVTVPSPPLGRDDVIDPWVAPRRPTGRP
ncbi:MAG: hypothetical protein ABUS79_04915 [Pseudomonadota bacterium]